MEKIKGNTPVLISIILAIIAGVLVFAVVRASAPTVPVVVANETLRVGLELEPGNLTVRNYPASAVPDSSFRSIDQVVGSTVINGPIVKDGIIRAENLSTDGSLLAMLKTFAPNGWSAAELSPGGGAGMTGLKRGDVVDIYTEVGSAKGIAVGAVCKNAIVLQPIDPEKEKPQFIVAVPNEYAPAVAEIVVRNKPMTLILNNPATKQAKKGAAASGI